MPKQRELKFEECLALMRKRDALLAEEGFALLRTRAREYLPKLIEAFDGETSHSLRCWLLELIGEARSEEALPLLSAQALCGDESLRNWGIAGLRLLDTKASRTFLFEHGLK